MSTDRARFAEGGLASTETKALVKLLEATANVLHMFQHPGQEVDLASALSFEGSGGFVDILVPKLWETGLNLA